MIHWLSYAVSPHLLSEYRYRHSGLRHPHRPLHPSHYLPILRHTHCTFEDSYQGYIVCSRRDQSSVDEISFCSTLLTQSACSFTHLFIYFWPAHMNQRSFVDEFGTSLELVSSV
jgi:hypothetical protein